MSQYILALDQGTTSSRSILFDRDGEIVAIAQQELPQIYPAPGQVEHDPEEIWRTQTETMHEVIRRAEIASEEIAGIGITNQRETVLLWDRTTGTPVHNAIVWQSRVSAPICDRLRAEGCDQEVRQRTGLLIDPYFSGTKLTHLFETDPELRRRAEAGELAFGTVDSFLLWQLTGGRVHATDVSNASRTLLFNIHTRTWDDELLRMMGVPAAILPEVRPTSMVHGTTDLLGPHIPIGSLVGDQQAATFGQVCFDPGDAKNTYGTGAFLLMNIGHEPGPVREGLLTTIGWQLGPDQPVTYCLEGAVFVAGAVIQWLRDGLGILDSAEQSEALARSVSDTGGVYLVPAFVGLGAPHWDDRARGLIVGLTRGTERGHIVRAALESIAYQIRDLRDLMQEAGGQSMDTLRVDGGAAANDLLLAMQADVLGAPVERPVIRETTALGAAYLAGLGVGFWDSSEALRDRWVLDRRFEPASDEIERELRYRGWLDAVSRSKGWATRQE